MPLRLPLCGDRIEIYRRPLGPHKGIVGTNLFVPKIAQTSLCLQYLSLAEIVIWQIISGEGIMAQAEHLPIYKSAYDLCLYFEQVVRNFSRYHYAFRAGFPVYLSQLY